MTLQSSGPISLSNIATEFGGSAPHSLSEYRNKGNAPATGAIDLAADFYGTVNSYDPLFYEYNGSAVPIECSSLQGQTYQSLSLNGARIERLDIVCYGAGGAGARWPTGAAGGYGGHAYRITLTERSLLDQISSLHLELGNPGRGFRWDGASCFADNRQAGGAGGFTRVRLNNASGTILITAAGGHGARAVYQASPTTSSGYSPNAGFVGGAGGAGAPESYNAAGSNATYGGGGGGAHATGTGGTSTYSGNGGRGSTSSTPAPSGGGGGWDTQNQIRGGPSRIRIYVNNGGAIPF